MVGGNWKMNTDLATATELADDIVAGVDEALGGAPVEVIVFPPYPYVMPVGRTLGHSTIALGGQDCSAESNGAFTGQVSAEMLLDLGCTWVVIGHSERRHVVGESDELLHRKLKAALGEGLKVVFCVGETREEREAGRAEAVVARQIRSGLEGIPAAELKGVAIAYEPVWAIGTGVTATPEDAEHMHAFIREALVDLYDQRFATQTRIMYGGSVNAKNARALFDGPNIDGGLIGGASLKAPDFAAICRAAAEAWKAAGGH